MSLILFSSLTIDFLFLFFLLLARYVPNVAKRSRPYMRSVKKYYILGTDRPTDLTISKNSNDHISARGRPCLVLGWGFRGRPIEWRYFELDHRYVGENNARGVTRLVSGHNLKYFLFLPFPCAAAWRPRNKDVAYITDHTTASLHYLVKLY